MKWTGAVVVAAVAACSGNVKNPADSAGDAGPNEQSGRTSSAGRGGLGGGSHTSPAGGSINGGGFGARPGQGGDAGAPNDAGPGGSPVVLGDGGEGGVANDACDDENGNGCIIEYGDDITALAAGETAVYWVTHGTVDALGNYQNDGRLFKREAGSTKQLVSGLAGPVGLGLTSTHFYVYLDQAWDADGQYALARVPVAGGSAAIIQRGAQPVNARGDACPNCFAHSGSIAVFPLSDGIYEMDAADATGALVGHRPRAGQPDRILRYFEGGAGDTDQIWRTPLIVTGSQPERIAATPSSVIQAVGDQLYGMQAGEATYFTSMPLTGSMWTRRRKVEPGAIRQLDIADATCFYDVEQYNQPYRIYESLVGSTSTSGNLILSVPRKANVKAWVGTASGLYWTDGHSLRLRSGFPE